MVGGLSEDIGNKGDLGDVLVVSCCVTLLRQG
jgi:hypothetical protein